MNIAIVAAVADRDKKALAALDRACFLHEEDQGEPWYYAKSGIESFWVKKDRKRIGAISLMQHRTYAPDPRCLAKHSPDTLYLLSTALLPEFRGRGIGAVMKAWQVAYARMNGFARIVTHARIDNATSIALNKKFGFRETARLPFYYDNGADALVMELILSDTKDSAVRPREISSRDSHSST